MKKVLTINIIFLIIACFFCTYYINSSYSLPVSDSNIIKTNSISEASKYSNPSSDDSFITINTDTGSTSDGSFKELTGTSFSDVVEGSDSIEEKQEKITEYINNNEFYAINDVKDDDTLEIVALYSNKRVKVITNDKNINTYGASNGINFNNYYILSYKTDEETKIAYDKLKEKYGDDKVILDLPLKATSARGWGTSFMNFNNKLLDLDLNNNVIVAVLDTGINKNHNIFKGRNILNGLNMIRGNNNTYDDNGHGTAVSGIISESTGSNVSILPIKVLDAKGNGSLIDILFALKYANSKGAKIANMSFALNAYSSDSEKAYNDVIFNTINNMDKELSKLQLFMVCASGNENLNADIVYSYPASSGYTVSVGSINNKEKRSYFSNYGKTLDFTAPGEDITIAKSNSTNSYKIGSGTSFSAPYIAASAGIVLTEHPNYSNLELKNYLINISKDLGANGKDENFGNGVPIFNNKTEFSDDYFIEKYKTTLSSDSLKYDGTSKCVDAILKDSNENILDSSNYTISCFNNKNAGKALVTITGKNNYYGTIIKNFSIEKAKLEGRIVLSNDSYTYDGTNKKPSIKVYDNNNQIIDSKYYTISYSNNINVGAANVTITGKKNYYGSLTKTFIITKSSFNDCQLDLVKSNYSYTGKAIKPTFTLSKNGKRVGESNYTISYKNNKNIGKSTLTITGKNNYSGTLNKTFKIVPKKPSIEKIKRSKTKVKIKIKKTNDSPTKYEIKFKKEGSSKWNKKYISSKSFTIKKLKKNKNYYIKVRSYKIINNTKYYSSWSKSYNF